MRTLAYVTADGEMLCEGCARFERNPVVFSYPELAAGRLFSITAKAATSQGTLPIRGGVRF